MSNFKMAAPPAEINSTLFKRRVRWENMKLTLLKSTPGERGGVKYVRSKILI